MAPQGAVLIFWLLLLSSGQRQAGALVTTTPTPFTAPPSAAQAQEKGLAGLLRRAAPMGDLRCFCLPRWPTEGQSQASTATSSLSKQRNTGGPSTETFFPFFTNLNPPPVIQPSLNTPPITQPPTNKRIDAITGNRMTPYRPGREPWRVQATSTCRNSFRQQFPYLLRQDC